MTDATRQRLLAAKIEREGDTDRLARQLRTLLARKAARKARRAR